MSAMGAASRWGGRLLRGVGLLGAFVTATVAGIALHADLPLARRVAARAVAGALTDLLDGTVELAPFSHIGPTRITTPRATLLDAYGHRVLSLFDLRIDLSMRVLLNDLLLRRDELTVIVDHVRVERAEVALYADPHTGEPTIARAIVPTRTQAGPSAGGAGTERDDSAGVRVYLPAVEVGLVLANAKLRDSPPLEAEVRGVKGQLLVTPKGLAADVNRFGAVLRGFGADARGTGTLGVRAPGPARGTFRGFFGDVELDASAFLDGRHVELTFDVPGASPEAVRRVLPGWPLRETIAGRVEARGDLPNLALSASLRARSAHIKAEGPIVVSEPPSADLRVQSRHLDARLLFEQAPPTDLAVDGSIRARIEQGRLVADVRAHVDATAIEGRAVPAIDVDGRLGAAGFTGTANVHEPGLPMKADFVVAPSGAVDVEATVPTFDLAQFERLPDQKLRGRGHARVHAHIEERTVSASIDAEATGVAVAGVTAARAHVTAEGKAPLDALERLRGTGHVTAERIVVRGFTVDHVVLDARGVREAVAFDATAMTADGPTVHAKGMAMVSNGLVVRDTLVFLKQDPVTIEGEIASLDPDRGSVDIRNLRVRGAGGEVKGSARLAEDLVELEAEGENVDLDALARALGLPPSVLGGRMRISANIAAGRDVTRGRVRLGLGNASIGPVSGVSMQLSANLDGAGVTGDASGLVAGLGTFGASWDARLAGPAFEVASWRGVTGQGEVQLSDVFLPAVIALMPKASPVKRVDGRGYARFVLSRSSSTAPLPSVVATAATRGFAIEVQPAGSEKPIRIAGMDLSATGTIDGVTGESTGTTLVSDARGDLLTASGAIRVDVDGIVHEPALALARLVDAPLDVVVTLPSRPIPELPELVRPEGLGGSVAGTVILRGSLTKPTLFATVDGSQVSALGSVRPVDVHAEGQYDWNTDATSTRATAVLAGRPVATATFRGSLPGGEVAKWEGGGRVELDGFPLDLLSGGSKAGALTGRLFGNAAFERSATGGGLTADVRLTEVAVDRSNLGEGSLQVETVGNATRVRLAMEGGRGHLDASGKAVLSWATPVPALAHGAPVSAHVEAKDFDAVALSPLVRGVLGRIGGHVDANLDVALEPEASADGAETKWSGGARGTASLREGSVLIEALGLEIKDLSLRAEARSQARTTAVALRDVRGRVRSAKDNVTAVADLVFDGISLSGGKAALVADDLPILFRGAPQGRVTGMALARVTREPHRMLVDVQIPRLITKLPQSSARNVIDLGDNPDVKILQLERDEGEGGDVMPWHVTVHLGNEVRLRRKDVDLGVTGNPVVDLGQDFALGGSVELVPGGRIPVLGKVFIVEQGHVVFDTGDPSNPRVDVHAMWRSPDETVVYVDVTGTLREAKIALRSDPPLPEPQVFALLLGGSSSEASGGSTDESGGGGAAGAVAIGSGVGALGVNELLSDSPVELRVETTSESKPRYTAAVRVRQNLWFEASTYQQTGQSVGGSTDKSVFSGTVDYRFTRRWSLRTEVGTSGGAMDLLWQYRY